MHVSHCEQQAVGSRNNTTAAPPEMQEQGSLCVSPTVWNPSPAAAALTNLSCTLPGQRAPDSSFTISETGHLKINNLMTNNFFHVYMCACVRMRGGQRSISGGPPSFSISFVKTGSLTSLTRLAVQKPPGNLLYPLQHRDRRSTNHCSNVLWRLAVFVRAVQLNSAPHACAYHPVLPHPVYKLSLSCFLSFGGSDLSLLNTEIINVFLSLCKQLIHIPFEYLFHRGPEQFLKPCNVLNCSKANVLFVLRVPWGF